MLIDEDVAIHDLINDIQYLQCMNYYELYKTTLLKWHDGANIQNVYWICYFVKEKLNIPKVYTGNV